MTYAVTELVEVSGRALGVGLAKGEASVILNVWESGQKCSQKSFSDLCIMTTEIRCQAYSA